MTSCRIWRKVCDVTIRATTVRPLGRTFLDPSGSGETIELLRSMTSAIRQEFRYKRRSEKGIQSPGETLQVPAKAAAGISPC